MSKDESGAVLLLALVFILIVTFSILGLITFGGTGIKDAASLEGQRSLEYAADGATTAAIQAVRYSYYTFSNTTDNPQPQECLPNGASFSLPDSAPPMTINGVPMMVDCIAGLPSSSTPQFTRVITFYACTASNCSASNAVVAATVDFEDVNANANGVDECSPPPVGGGPFETTTCGMGETIQTWDVQTANG
jgi:hypothetical protein